MFRDSWRDGAYVAFALTDLGVRAVDVDEIEADVRSGLQLDVLLEQVVTP